MNKKQGRGMLKLPFGIYQGSFTNGLLNGQGAFTWNDGRIYKGNFSNGKIHGDGTLTLTNGRVIVGEW